jgi:DNA repair protein RadA/Sms
MSRTRTVFRCLSCGATAPKWSGRCGTCGDWNTLSEELDEPGSTRAALVPTSPPVPITQVGTSDGRPVPSGLDEVDRVLGGGLVPGSVTLLGGEPGIGKSTLVLQLLAARSRAGATTLYVTGEESAEQVRLRADRLGALHDRVLLAAETSLPHVLDHLHTVRPELCVVDSVQTLHDPDLGSAPGSVTQVRECAHRLVGAAKRSETAVVLVGHVTKDGQLSGPRVLEHVVDTVVSLEGDRHHGLRLLRAVKHRFGPTGELGLFTVADSGLEPVPDPSTLFLADRRANASGSAVTATLEGHRALLVEVQALALPSSLAQPRRSVQGLDRSRVDLLVAVLQRCFGDEVGRAEIYATVVGGVRVAEPGADLAVCLAVLSSLVGRPVPAHVVACGEVGLSGEIRHVRGLEQRLAEAARLGFRTALVPRNASGAAAGLRLVSVDHLGDAVAALGLDGLPPGPPPSVVGPAGA